MLVLDLLFSRIRSCTGNFHGQEISPQTKTENNGVFPYKVRVNSIDIYFFFKVRLL